jgi:hypothetical protein
MAMRLERAHAEFVGQSHGLAVIVFGRLDLRRMALGGDRAEESEGIGLVALLLVGTGEREGAPGKGVCFLQAACEQVRFAEICHPEWVVIHEFHGGALLHGPLQQRQCLGEAPGERVGLSQGRDDPGEEELNVSSLTDTKALFEHSDSWLEVPFAEVEKTDAEICMAEREGLIDRLGELNGFFPTFQPLDKGSQFG